MNWDWDKLKERQQGQPGGSRGQGPDFDKINELIEKFRNLNLPGLPIVIGLILIIWLITGTYTVNTDEVGVVQRFGAFNRITQPGLHYHLPYPIETVQKPEVTQIRRTEIGFRGSGSSGAGYSGGLEQGQYRHVPQESLMLTGDENIIDVQFIVQYKISDTKNYLFNISQPAKTVKDAAEAAMREVIGYNKIDAALTSDKLAIQNDTAALLQEILDKYKSGINIVAVKLQDVHPPDQVIDAFKDVASAREDKSRYINEAQSYRNDLIPKARGQVATVVKDAEAYKESEVRKAKGESEQFEALLAEYQKAKEVTRKRLYLEAMEEVMSNENLDKILLSPKVMDQVLPYLPVDRMPGSRQNPKK